MKLSVSDVSLCSAGSTCWSLRARARACPNFRGPVRGGRSPLACSLAHFDSPLCALVYAFSAFHVISERIFVLLAARAACGP